MNNKGQTLALFVVVLPILVLLMVFIYDVGRMTLLKSELNNINYLTIDYGLNNINDISDNELREIILKNKNDIDDITINIHDNMIEITLKSSIKNNIKLLSDKDIFKVESSYYGIIDNDKKNICERD